MKKSLDNFLFPIGLTMAPIGQTLTHMVSSHTHFEPEFDFLGIGQAGTVLAPRSAKTEERQQSSTEYPTTCTTDGIPQRSDEEPVSALGADGYLLDLKAGPCGAFPVFQV